MTRIFIDVTGEESHWNGELGQVGLLTSDGLSGTDMAIAFGDHQLVLTMNQAITLFDLLDGWLNTAPVTESGAVRRRIHEAVRNLVEDNPVPLKKAFGPAFTQERFVREVEEYLRMNGLRFRLSGEAPAFAQTAQRRKPEAT